jgi:deoxyribose-phosphate aldolase
MNYTTKDMADRAEAMIDAYSKTTPPSYPVDTSNMGQYVDHTRLKVETTRDDIQRFCEEARKYRLAAVCFNPVYVPYAVSLLSGSPVHVATVVGFPLGSEFSITKAVDTRAAVSEGATEIDMVIAVGLLKSGLYEAVFDDIRAVVEAAAGRTVKVIIESSDLTDREKVIASILAKDAGAQYLKTSTGFGRGGATVADVALLKYIAGEEMKVKASTGIKTREDAIRMIQAGASRLGTSAGPLIVGG